MLVTESNGANQFNRKLAFCIPLFAVVLERTSSGFNMRADVLFRCDSVVLSHGRLDSAWNFESLSSLHAWWCCLHGCRGW